MQPSPAQRIHKEDGNGGGEECTGEVDGGHGVDLPQSRTIFATVRADGGVAGGVLVLLIEAEVVAAGEKLLGSLVLFNSY